MIHAFPMRMSPGETLDVRAPDIVAALDAACEALPYLRQEADTRGGVPVTDGNGPLYTLTCLLCGVTDLSDPEQNPLVALQEHQMQAYGFTPLAFQSALSVSRQMRDETRYVWVLPQAVADHLHLPQRCFMRATRRPPLEQQTAPMTLQHSPGVMRVLAFRHSVDGVVTQTISLEREDEHAWYGWPYGEEATSKCLVWPRSEWQLAADLPQ
jgi:hypothetical protein